MSVSDDRFAHTAHSHRRPRTRALLVALTANTLFAATSPASAPSDLVLFPTVTVAATGYGTAPFDMPFATSVLSADTLATRQPRTLPIALEELPGLMVQKTSSAQGAPYIRGFTGFRTLLLIDGIRLNNSVFREGPNQYWGTVDPLALSRLELVKGPASVLYGSDAVGGTVNAVSLTPTFSEPPSASSTSPSPAPPATAHVSHRYASADDSHVTRLAASARLSDRLAGQIGLSQKNYHDLRAGRGTGTQPRTGYSESGLDASLAYPIGPHARLTALAQDFTQDDAWRTHSTVFGSTWLGTRPGNDLQRSLDQSRRLFAVQLHADHLATPVDELHLSVSHQRQQEDQFRLRHDRRREDTGFAVATFGTFVQAQSPSPFGRWIYGGEFYRDRVDSNSIRYRADGSLNAIDIQGPVADDATYDLAGAYLENRLPRLGPVDLILGGRFNYAAADARRVRDPRSGATTRVTADWHALLASLRGVVRLDSAGRHNLFAGLSESFRAPNLSDLTRFDIAEGGQIETPAPGLEPEFFVTAEAGWRTRHERWSGTIAAFHTVIRNQIIRTPTGALVEGLAEVTKRNSGAGYVQGLELAGTFRLLPAWTLSTALTWMRGELDYFPSSSSASLLRAPLSRVMPLTGHVTLRWDAPTARTWLELAASAATRQDRLAPGDRVDTERIPTTGTPGYAVGKLRTGWRATAALTLTAALENLTDTDYRIHGSGLNEPGRNLILSAAYRY
jgi:hemoglobin/transferrin/lactoferrin receptor protein